MQEYQISDYCLCQTTNSVDLFSHYAKIEERQASKRDNREAQRSNISKSFVLDYLIITQVNNPLSIRCIDI